MTIETILDDQNPRNRRLAEALGRCGLIERAGQGMNLMFERSIRHSKPLPDLSGTGPHTVRLTLHGTVTNPAFLRFLEKVGEETLATFSTRDLILLDHLQREDRAPAALRNRLPGLIELGVVERVGRGRGARYHSAGASMRSWGGPAPIHVAAASIGRRTRRCCSGTCRIIPRREAPSPSFSRCLSASRETRCAASCRNSERRAESAWRESGVEPDGSPP